MKVFIPWLVVLIYLVPIIGTLASMRRRAAHIWSFGDSLRRLLPEDRFYRWVKALEGRYLEWKKRQPLTPYINFDLLNLTAGKIEYAIGHSRDYTIGVYMMGVFVYDLTLMVFSGDASLRSNRFPSLFYHGFFALLSLWTYRRHVTIGLKMTEFMRTNPLVHPEEFFHHYYQQLGPSAIPVPAKATRTVDPTNISYLTGSKPRQSFWIILHGLYDTTIFARSAYRALETVGQQYGREVFDAMASLWGSRMLQLFKSRLVVEGIEKFHSLSGKVILVFNHKSILDFVLNFFALSSTHLATGRRIRPRYMGAKDHLVDNKLVYTGVGIGKLIENVDMVFVDRKGKGKKAILEASQRLAEKEIEIAMYPQGTRALGNQGPRGERQDAGYYTTGTATSLKKELGYLKKGCVYLAVDTAIALRERKIPVHLVPIGIDGTATLLPKGSMKAQTEGTIQFTVGEVLTLPLEEIDVLTKPVGEEPQNEGERQYLELIEHLQREIDHRLVSALNLHERLRTRFLHEVKGYHLIPKENFFAMHRQWIESERQGPLPFLILDRIYAIPPEDRLPFLKEMAQRLAEGRELVSLRNQVTDRLFRHRGKELKTVVQQEKHKKVS